MSVHYVTVDGNKYKVTIEEVSSTEVALPWKTSTNSACPRRPWAPSPVWATKPPRPSKSRPSPSCWKGATSSPPPAPAPAPKAEPAAVPAGDGEVQKAPLQGTVLRIQAKPGDSVQAGDTILILEAMKMENEIVAPKDGVVGTILVKEGQLVDADEDLYELK